MRSITRKQTRAVVQQVIEQLAQSDWKNSVDSCKTYVPYTKMSYAKRAKKVDALTAKVFETIGG